MSKPEDTDEMPPRDMDLHKDVDLASIPKPPESLTNEEKARWWGQENLPLVNIGYHTGLISQEVWKIMVQSAKDASLANKVIDRNSVPNLTVEERSRIFNLLTTGGDWSGGKKGRPTTFSRNLQIVEAIKGVTDVIERNRIIRVMVDDAYGTVTNNISNFVKKINSCWERFNDKDRELILALLKANPDQNFSEDSLRFIVKIEKCKVNIVPHEIKKKNGSIYQTEYVAK